MGGILHPYFHCISTGVFYHQQGLSTLVFGSEHLLEKGLTWWDVSAIPGLFRCQQHPPPLMRRQNVPRYLKGPLEQSCRLHSEISHWGKYTLLLLQLISVPLVNVNVVSFGTIPCPSFRMYLPLHCHITVFARLSNLMNSEPHRAGFIFISVYHGYLQEARRQSRANRLQSTEEETLASAKQMLITHTYLGRRGATCSSVHVRPKSKSHSHVIFPHPSKGCIKHDLYVLYLPMKRWGLMRKNSTRDAQVFVGHSFKPSHESPQTLLAIKYLARAESVAISPHPWNILEASVVVFIVSLTRFEIT